MLTGHAGMQALPPGRHAGSPKWDGHADLVGRAMRLISNGGVDCDGVAGLARQLGYSPRHVHRQLVAVAGVGELFLVRDLRRLRGHRGGRQGGDVGVRASEMACG